MKNKMFDMFKSWAYWKPIVILLSSITAIVSFIAFTPMKIIGFVFAIGLLAMFLFLLHIMGAAFYESYMSKIKINYRKLTDKDWDDQ